MRLRPDEMTITLRATKEFWDGAVVHLGYGMSGLCSLYVPEGRRVIFYTENGSLGFGPVLTEGERNKWDMCVMNDWGNLSAGLRGCLSLTMLPLWYDHGWAY